MVHLKRQAAAIFAVLSLCSACKLSERLTHRSHTDSAAPSPSPSPSPNGDALPALRDLPYTVTLSIVPSGETPVVTWRDLAPIFAESCTSCHGAGQQGPDLTSFPIKGNYATQAEAGQKIFERISGQGARMPPAPATALTSESAAKIKSWLTSGQPAAPLPPKNDPFVQGLALSVRFRIAGSDAWTEATWPWNGKGEFSDFARQVGAGSRLDFRLAALGEDKSELAIATFSDVKVPLVDGVTFALSVDETAVKLHAKDSSAAVPGGDGKLTIPKINEQSLRVHWEEASDALTLPFDLQYAVFVSPDFEFKTTADALTRGTKLRDFAPYADGVTIDKLQPGTDYFVAVLVKDRGGNLALYKTLKQATAKDRAPPVVATSQLTVSGLSDRGLKLAWEKASDNLTPVDHLRYQVYYSFTDDLATASAVEVSGWPATGLITDQASVVLKGLVPEAEYYFTVVVRDGFDNRTPYARVHVTTPSGIGPLTIQEYGKQCAERLGTFKPINCLDGQIVPTAIDGVEIKAGLTAQEAAAYQFGTGGNQMNCDKPAMLGLGDQGHCIPYSRLGAVKSYRADGSENPNVDTVFTCRRYTTHLGPTTYQGTVYDGATYPLFEDVAVLQHDRVTGESCWYQMLKPNYAPMDGRRVPPPTEDSLPAGSPGYAVAASQFWLTPQSAADKKCNRCHDADPWMHSPYVDQVRNADGHPLVPSGAFGGGESGRYSMIGSRAFNKWEKSLAIASTDLSDTDGKSCTSCHNVGSLNDCAAWARQAAGTALNANLSSTGQAFAHRYWMPPGAPAITSLAAWQSSGFKRAAERLLACCDQPNQAGCSKTPIMTPPPPFAAP